MPSSPRRGRKIQRRAKLLGLGARNVSPQFLQRTCRRIIRREAIPSPRELTGWQGTYGPQLGQLQGVMLRPGHE